MRIAWMLVGLVACRPPGWGRDDVQVDASAGVDGPRADAPGDGASATTCTKTFRLEGHASATSVVATGTFSAWDANPPSATAMTLGGDSAWTGSRELGAGVYQYKFVVSGTQWIMDPGNPDGIDDGLGGRNSLYTCVP